MPFRTQSGRSSFLVGTALLLYLYWILDFLAIQNSWLCLLAFPALVPVRASCLAAMAVLVTASSLTFVMLTGVRPSFDATAVGVTCAAIPAVLLMESVRGTLLSPWFAAAAAGGHWAVAALRRICICTAVLLFVPLISRHYPVEIAVPFIVALLITVRALPAPVRTARTIWARSANVSLAVVGVAIGLVVLEVGARRFIPPAVPEVGMLQPDPRTIFRLRPSSSAYFHFPVEDNLIDKIRVDISAQGLRDRTYGPKAEDEFRILLLGDSFTFGQTVEFADTIGRRLESMLQSDGRQKKAVVINFGVPATGPWQQQIFLEDAGFALHRISSSINCFLGTIYTTR